MSRAKKNKWQRGSEDSHHEEHTEPTRVGKKQCRVIQLWHCFRVSTSPPVVSAHSPDFSRTLVEPLKASKANRSKERKIKWGRGEVKRSTQRRREEEQLVFSGEWWRVSFTLSPQIRDRGSLAIPGLPLLMFGEF